MSPLITYMLLIFLTLFGIFVIVELITSRSFKRFVIQFVAILFLVVLLRVTTGFPVTRTAFGGFSQLTAVIIMFAGTLIGIAAHYLFYLRGKFSWRKFLKPFVISPIVLLPLIGSVQQASEVEIIQLISFGVLSYQSGFFWKEVLERAKRKM